MKNYRPLIKPSKMPYRPLSARQKTIVEQLNCALTKELHSQENRCLCGGGADLLISTHDTFGVQVPIVMCKKCGLVRLARVLSEESSIEFYSSYYRQLYDNFSIDAYFEWESNHSQTIFDLLYLLGIEKNIHVVAEMGCGAGGTLVSFANNGMMCTGIDYGEKYVQYGKAKHIKNLILQVGSFEKIIAENSCDLIILSHVLEHLPNPVKEVQMLMSKLKIGGYLYIEVPSLHKKFKRGEHLDHICYPISGLQMAHIWYFYEEWLQVFFEKLGLKVIHYDDKCPGCRFVLQKINDNHPVADVIYNEQLKSFYDRHLADLRKKQVLYRLYPLKKYLYNVACLFGWRRIRKYFRK